MWTTRTETLDKGRLQRFQLLHAETTLSYAEVIDLWCENEEFRAFYNSLLADTPFSSFRWETPAVTAKTVERDFEFVVLRSDALDRSVDQRSFAGQFDSEREVVTFSNLSRDAILVVPCPAGEDSCYGHLGAFVRSAPESQRYRLWQAVGQAMKSRLNDRPVWLSTAGMGVAWLHVRLDDRPKYYGYTPYKQSQSHSEV